MLETLWVVFKRKKSIIVFLLLILALPTIDLHIIKGQIEKKDNLQLLNASYLNLNMSTYLGGVEKDTALGIAVANDNNCYVTGYTNSTNFPTLNAYDDTKNVYEDVFIAKFSSNGTLLWSTFVGGSFRDSATGIAVTSDGSCYVTGNTQSNNFPTLNAYDNTLSGETDAFIAKFSTNGSLLWSTYLGGSNSDYGRGITTNNNDSCYVVGSTYSDNFPIKNGYDDNFNRLDVFIVKLSTNCTLLWSTYFGGNINDFGLGIAVSSDGSCYVTGETTSTNFPIENGYDNTFNGGYNDAFISKFIEINTPNRIAAYVIIGAVIILIPIIIVLFFKRKK